MTEGETGWEMFSWRQPEKKKKFKEEEGIVTWRGERGRGANNCQQLSSPWTELSLRASAWRKTKTTTPSSSPTAHLLVCRSISQQTEPECGSVSRPASHAIRTMHPSCQTACFMATSSKCLNLIQLCCNKMDFKRARPSFVFLHVIVFPCASLHSRFLSVCCRISTSLFRQQRPLGKRTPSLSAPLTEGRSWIQIFSPSLQKPAGAWLSLRIFELNCSFSFFLIYLSCFNSGSGRKSQNLWNWS